MRKKNNKKMKILKEKHQEILNKIKNQKFDKTIIMRRIMQTKKE